MHGTPEQIDIMVTAACPARCPFCVQEATYVPIEATEAVFLDAVREHVREFHALGGRKVVITGGEPLVAIPRVLRVLEVLSKYDFTVNALYTNGARLLDRDRSGLSTAERLAAARLGYVNLSVHHDDDAVNQRIFGLRERPGTDAMTTHLKSCGLAFRFNAVLQQGALSSAEDVTRYVRWAFGLGAEDIYMRELFSFTFAEPKGMTRYDPIPYSVEARVAAVPIIEELIAAGEFHRIGERRETARVKTETKLLHRPTGRYVYLSSLAVGSERPDEVPYLVVMPDGWLYRGWLGEQDRIESLAASSAFASAS